MCRGYYWIPCATWADHSYLLLLQQRRRCPALPSPVSINTAYSIISCGACAGATLGFLALLALITVICCCCREHRRYPAMPSSVSITNSILLDLLWCLCRRDPWISCATGADHSDLLLLPKE